MSHALFATPFGTCGIGWNDVGVTAFALPPATAAGWSTSGADQTQTSTLPPKIAALIERVVRHLNGASQDFGDVGYDFSVVTPFQREVYNAALRVRPGETRTYGWLAQQTGRGAAASRAIGGALGKNPWPLLVPCHRFIGANGKMTGFSAPGGLVTKRRLLALEGAELLAEV
jgi:methylated-DNA-[protein]-cysteine S-methyltransferase